MNLQVWGRRILGRATCVLGPSVRLGFRARIYNIFGDSRRINIGAHSVILGDLLVFAHGGQVELGKWCFVGEGSRIWSGAHVRIGDRVLISHGVNIFDGLTHPRDAEARHAHFRHIVERGHPKHVDLGDRPITIEDDAWIGAGAIILRGVHIGRGAIVGAGSVVARDVPAWTTVAGNPARVIREPRNDG